MFKTELFRDNDELRTKTTKIVYQYFLSCFRAYIKTSRKNHSRKLSKLAVQNSSSIH